MTAFDNIKTNNWPATFNDFEDFLVLKMPLNDQASLTESLPVVAGSQELSPKRTLTNSGVSSLTAGPTYSDTLTVSSAHPNNTSPTAGFDGNTATSHIGGVGATAIWDARNYSFPANSTVEVYSYTNGGQRSWAVDTGSGYGSEITEVSGWQNLGTYSNIQYIRNSSDANVGYGPGFGAIRINGTVLVDAPGGSKKHYPENATFNGSSHFLYHAPDKKFNLGTDDWCIECWFKKDNLTATGQLFQLGLEVNYTNNIEISVNTSGAMRYHMYGNGQSQEGFTSSNNVVTAGTWHHMACTRQGTTFRGFLDGVQLGSWTKAATWNVGSSNSDHNTPTIGARTNGSRNAMHNYFGGSIQDFRIYKGVAKYTANFTPPGAILG